MRLRFKPWMAVVAILVPVSVFIALALFSGGSSSGTVASIPAREDPLAGVPADRTFTIEAGDSGSEAGSFFAPTTITAGAGEVIEIVVHNTGTMSHNLQVAGLDGEYNTADDFATEPFAIKAGQEARVKVKIDQPGTYAFRCAFHPRAQTGTLVLN